ncbi:BREX-2 system adenine-specific DNA-methyltransferase PglX [Streptomyces sp. RLB1-9]|uniref:BREX-2 system adenine-specific DNA-methyltransferase PglX n=1 Tax=Streptomyces sp. RLB1-9 TaxID=2594454 RepID=UPI00116353F0|nr:BREX-2 system adenine-specific DNA-methyltransferase PglX [Streptomyces sp. RLB1-9]
MDSTPCQTPAEQHLPAPSSSTTPPEQWNPAPTRRDSRATSIPTTNPQQPNGPTEEPTDRHERSRLGIRGESSIPEAGDLGPVWLAIVDQVRTPGTESEWVSSIDARRSDFATYPWSLSGGGAAELNALIGKFSSLLGARLSRPIGFASFPGQDDVFFLADSWFKHRPDSISLRRDLVNGDVVRDWAEACDTPALVPYDDEHAPVPIQLETSWGRHLWLMRTTLGSTTGFDGTTRADSNEPWWTWYRWVAERYRTPLAITFASIGTHAHFALDRGGKVFNRHAPVIKLPEEASEDQYLELLGILNSSTVCFWLKQVSQAKGGADNSSGGGNRWAPEAWITAYEFAGTKLQELPLPVDLPLDLSRALDSLAQELARYEPSAVAATAVPTRGLLEAAQAAHGRVRSRMIALQEELDWTVYGSYNLLTPAEASRATMPSTADAPAVALGERAFEIVLARKVAAGEAQTAWFERHRSTPVTEIPAHWPDGYRAVVQARIDIIKSRKDIALIERAECKRRWASDSWEKKEKEALRAWLLDKCEDGNLWFGLRDGMRQPRALTVSQLADVLRQDADVQAVAELYAADHLGKRDATFASVLVDIFAGEHVPYLATLRYKDSGLRKREQWEQVWELQRQEDKAGKRLGIPVPPKYSAADFHKHSYWSHRGKLDVPKERFISYPEASPDSDPTLLLGWAGWDYKDQVQALVNVINDRTEQAAWETSRIVPLLAGVQELMPWVHQWHGEYDDDWDGTPAEEYQAYLDEQRAKHGLSAEDLKAWRPEKKTRGRAKKAD